MFFFLKKNRRKSTVFHLLWYKRANIHSVLLCSWFFFSLLRITYMTDFSLTLLQSNYIICIYVKKIWLNFFSLCVFFFFFSFIHSVLLLFYPTISFALMNLLSAQLSHQNILKEREKKNSCHSSYSLFLFLLLGCPFSVSFFISGFVIFPPSLYDTTHVRTYKLKFDPHCSNVRCSYTFMLSFGAIGGAWCLIQVGVAITIRNVALFVTYIWICEFFQILKRIRLDNNFMGYEILMERSLVSISMKL